MNIRNKDIMAGLPLVASILGNAYGVSVHIGGDVACTNGTTIILPALPLACEHTLLMLARAYVDHEAAHIRSTDFEALRQAGLSPFQKHLWNILEDHRVEQQLAIRFPECRQHFRWLIRYHFGTAEVDCLTTQDSPHLLIPNWILLAVRAWEVPDIVSQRDNTAKVLHRVWPCLIPLLDAVLKRVRQHCRNTLDTNAVRLTAGRH